MTRAVLLAKEITRKRNPRKIMAVILDKVNFKLGCFRTSLETDKCIEKIPFSLSTSVRPLR
jgi:hypothetical protein